MKLLRILEWLADFLVDTLILFIMVGFVIPFMIVCWCFYHPVLAKLYIANALPLLIGGNWATRGVLAVMILLAMLAFKYTHKFAATTLKLACLVGAGMYIIACF